MDVWNQWPKDGSIPEYVQRYVDWLVMPRWERPKELSSEKAWAVANGFSTGSLSSWKKDARVKAAIQRRCDELNLSPDRIQDVMNAIFRAATEGGMKAAT